MTVHILWNKESALPNALYVDLLEEASSSRFYSEATVEIFKHARKDNDLSLRYRQDGNIEFQQSNAKKAMELFNKSLCFAESDSEHISLAYAKRALCFFNLKMYQKCISDIVLAKEANYPENLMAELEQHESECRKRLKRAVDHTVAQPSLSYTADECIPSMANAIKIDRNNTFGRHIVAQCDIDEDKTVLIEEPMFKLLTAAEFKKCLVCLKENENLIPCTNCTNAMFCAGTCTSNEFHKYECAMKRIKYFEGDGGVIVRNSVRFAMQTVLKMLNNFSSSDEMIRFVQECIEEIRSDPLEIAVSDGSAESDFKAYMKLHYIKSSAKSDNEAFAIYVIHACIAYKTLMSHSDMEEKFESLSNQRFLMHLMTHVIATFKSNNVVLREWDNGDIEAMSTDGLANFGVALFNIGCYFNHSCLSNVIKVTNEKYSIAKTVRPIKAGEQLCVKYCVSSRRPTKDRREFLWKTCRFVCNCELCMENGPSDIERNSVVEWAYRVLACHTASLMFKKRIPSKELEKMKKKCYEFLAKFRNMPTSERTITVYENLRTIYMSEMQNV